MKNVLFYYRLQQILLQERESAAVGQTWKKQGNCYGPTPRDDLFFSSGNKNKQDRERICAPCPVRLQCLEYAIMYDEKGVWGNTTESERKRLVTKLPGFRRLLLLAAAEKGRLEIPIASAKDVVLQGVLQELADRQNPSNSRQAS